MSNGTNSSVSGGVTVTTVDLTQNASYTHPEVDVLFVDLQAVAAYVDPAVGLFFTDPATAVQVSELALGLTYTQPAATEVRFDPFFKYRALTDTATLTDTVVLVRGVFYTFSHTCAVTDNTALNIAKTVSDGVFLDDAVVDNHGAVVEKTNLIAIGDVASFTIAKSAGDALPVTETHAVAVGKILVDTAAVSDIVSASLVFAPSSVVGTSPLNTFELN